MANKLLLLTPSLNTRINTSADTAIGAVMRKRGMIGSVRSAGKKGETRNLHVHGVVDEGQEMNQASNGRAGISQSIQSMYLIR